MFKNLATRYKLLISFSIIILCILIIVPTACFSLAAKSSGDKTSQTAKMLWREADDVALMQMIMSSSSTNQPQSVAEFSRAFNDFSEHTTELNSHLDVQRSAALDQNLPALRTGLSQYKHLAEAGDVAGADKVASTLVPRSKSMHNQLVVMANEYPRGGDNQNDAIMLIAVVGVLSVVYSIFCFIALCEEIATPLQELTRASERLAQGDLSVKLPDSNRSDEVGAVVRAYQTMVGSLRNISSAAQRVAQGDLSVDVEPRSEEDLLGKAFASMVDNMASATSQIKSAVEVLSSAVGNIMASVSDSASGATQTATAVTETTTTVEEVRQTSHIANQKAKNVAESAQKSAQISNAGRKSTEETIQGMKRIREQMDLIADSMVRLSEKSQSIVEIIATVDDLAQQSNLLAVNASIEAAKAGDLGRGFAVVAQEVKSMSDQSKQATAQVRKILGEIQQATTSAAMATELGSRAVDAAVLQSNQAGEAISTLATSVVDSANAAAQIAVSSQQQLAGVDQVATAMLGIKDATAQNLIAIRRVEEATLTLQELGGTLKVLTKRYQL